MADAYIADTHGLLWFLAGSSRLSPAARTIFRAARAGEVTIYVPVIVVAEIIWVVQSGNVSTDLARLLATIRTHYQVIPLTLEDVSHLSDLPRSLEMHDRMIVWETLKRQATLVTRDETIRAVNVVPTVW